MSLIDLTGRVAVVTGARRGIGLAIAEIMAEHGATLVVSTRTAETAQACAEALASNFGIQAHGVVADVRNSAEVSGIFKAAFAQFKRLDIVVNNAGILGDGLLGMIPDALVQDTLATNVSGVIHAMQGAARLMRRSGGGSIINIASIIGTRGNVGQVVYSASKSAVIGATRSAAKELAAANIRVNALAPGYIQTDMIAHLSPEIHAERLASIAMKRIGQARDVARVALFLASDLSVYVTGQVIGVDGGMVI